MAGFGLASFALSFAGYWRPNGTSCWTLGTLSRCGIFDELYFARAGEEYLQNLRIYENTHPPLSKLLVTLSMMLFGGMPHGHGLGGWTLLNALVGHAGDGDNPYGWRFLDVAFGALAVMVSYAFAKRVTGSSAFASLCALLFTVDGMHFVQSRIATPEGFVVFFATMATYAFYRFWTAAQPDDRAPTIARDSAVPRVAAAAVAGFGLAWICRAIWHLETATTVLAGFYLAFAAYLAIPRLRPEPAARPARFWLLVFSVALGCLVSSKWYGVMGFGLSFGAIVATAALPDLAARFGRSPVRPDVALVTIVFVSSTVYALAWMPDLLRHSGDPGEIHSLDDVVERQQSMFVYHDVTVRSATHPYSSKWWEWPLDLVPVAYYYQDRRSDRNDPNGCCIYEITSMPNPAILWFGLLCVPLVGRLAWRRGDAGYAIVSLAIVLQWLPWMASPRITFAYHFYVDVPLICLCDAIVLQQFWEWGRAHRHRGNAAMAAVVAVAYAGAAVGAFVYFYPILAAAPISWTAWHARMWFPTWIIGPG